MAIHLLQSQKEIDFSEAENLGLILRLRGSMYTMGGIQKDNIVLVLIGCFTLNSKYCSSASIRILALRVLPW